LFSPPLLLGHIKAALVAKTRLSQANRNRPTAVSIWKMWLVDAV